jgi:hypothetical protein
MLFNIHLFLEEVLANHEKSEVFQKYFTHIQPRETIENIESFYFYRDYVSGFRSLPVNVPLELQFDFDFDLFVKLASASFSTVTDLEINPFDLQKVDFVINVITEGQVVSKNLKELWGFQVLTMFEIYVTEQVELAWLIHEDENEKRAILMQRETILNRWNELFDKTKLDIERIKLENDLKRFL